MSQSSFPTELPEALIISARFGEAFRLFQVEWRIRKIFAGLGDEVCLDYVSGYCQPTASGNAGLVVVLQFVNLWPGVPERVVMQEREHPERRKFVWLRRIIIAVVVICFVMDFLPRHGAPDFRYTGSDPAFDVWNFGWPLALAIYDSRFGIHFGPVLYLLVPFQLFAVALLWATLAILKRHNHPVEENGGEPFRFVSDEKT